MIREFPLFNKRGVILSFWCRFLSQVYAGPGRAKRFMVFPVSKHSIVGMLMGYGAMMDFLGQPLHT